MYAKGSNIGTIYRRLYWKGSNYHFFKISLRKNYIQRLRTGNKNSSTILRLRSGQVLQG